MKAEHSSWQIHSSQGGTDDFCFFTIPIQ